MITDLLLDWFIVNGSKVFKLILQFKDIIIPEKKPFISPINICSSNSIAIFCKFVYKNTVSSPISAMNIKLLFYTS